MTTITMKTQSNLISLVDNATTSKIAFMMFITKHCEVKDAIQLRKLESIVKDATDAQQWFAHWNGDNNSVKETTAAYKASKLAKNKLTLQEFMVNCALDLRKGIESLFQNTTQLWEIKKLVILLENGDMNLQDVYMVNQLDGWYDSLSKIVRSKVNATNMI